MIKTFDFPAILEAALDNSGSVIVSGPYVWTVEPYIHESSWMLEILRGFFDDKNGIALVYSPKIIGFYTIYKRPFVTGSTLKSVSVPLTSVPIDKQPLIMAYRDDRGLHNISTISTPKKNDPATNSDLLSVLKTRNSSDGDYVFDHMTSMFAQSIVDSVSGNNSSDLGGGGTSGGGGASGDW